MKINIFDIHAIWITDNLHSFGGIGFYIVAGLLRIVIIKNLSELIVYNRQNEKYTFTKRKVLI